MTAVATRTGKSLRRRYGEHDDGDQPDEEASPEIHAKAVEVLEHGDPIQYIVDSCGRMVVEAEQAFRKLCCCAAVQLVRQSAGLHPKMNGESGSGKTFIVFTFAHHLPPSAVVKGSSSNMAVFYHDKGDRVFRILDDYNAGNETLDTIIKQTTSVFHQKYAHDTVKKQEAVTLYIGSEQTWVITSVDSGQDIQVLNRQLPISVKDSEEITKKVNRRTIERYGKGEEQFPVDEQVLVSREICRILREDGLIDVKIPYINRIKWLDNSNRRNPSIFMDLLIAHTVMNRFQRQKDADGYYLATEDDFNSATNLFREKDDAEELMRKMTPREKEVIDFLLKPENKEGTTRFDIAKELEVAPQRVSQIINGENGKGGLTQKILIKTTKVSDMVYLGNDMKKTTYKTLYSLENYEALESLDDVVKLEKNEMGVRKIAI